MLTFLAGKFEDPVDGGVAVFPNWRRENPGPPDDLCLGDGIDFRAQLQRAACASPWHAGALSGGGGRRGGSVEALDVMPRLVPQPHGTTCLVETCAPSDDQPCRRRYPRDPDQRPLSALLRVSTPAVSTDRIAPRCASTASALLTTSAGGESATPSWLTFAVLAGHRRDRVPAQRLPGSGQQLASTVERRWFQPPSVLILHHAPHEGHAFRCWIDGVEIAAILPTPVHVRSSHLYLAAWLTLISFEPRPVAPPGRHRPGGDIAALDAGRWRPRAPARSSRGETIKTPSPPVRRWGTGTANP